MEREISTIRIECDWLQKALPEGMPYPTSTLISGPGGTGKPLVEFAFVASWLKTGGNAVAIPLQYPDARFIDTTMQKLYNMRLDRYQGRVTYIEFEPYIKGFKETKTDTIKANLLEPDTWESVIERAEKMMEKSSLGTLVFGSALNLLLFSPTYRQRLLEYLHHIIRDDKSKTYIFSVSTSAFAEEISLWEKSADNLMYTRMEKPMKLFFKIKRMKDVTYIRDEISVPISKEMLLEIKATAEMTRKGIIPQLSNI